MPGDDRRGLLQTMSIPTTHGNRNGRNWENHDPGGSLNFFSQKTASDQHLGVDKVCERHVNATYNVCWRSLFIF